VFVDEGKYITIPNDECSDITLPSQPQLFYNEAPRLEVVNQVSSLPLIFI